MNNICSQQAALILNGLPHVGPVTYRRLQDKFMLPPESILTASTKDLLSIHGIGEVISDSIQNWNRYFNLEREEKRLNEFNHAFIAQHDTRFPSLLKEIYDTPIGLYWHGSLKKIDSPCIAIVGTRRCTHYGKSFARKLAHDLSKAGICIVSGLARGIDTEAHEGALDAGGSTIAVLGNGLDIIYPPENKDLYGRISQNGAIISEFPYGRRGDKQTFPMRNRIVAGLCHGIIIIESDTNGGSMITARFAEEQNRLVFALPGRIDQKYSQGCNQLIRDGATLVTCAEDIIESLQPQIDLPLFAPANSASSSPLPKTRQALSKEDDSIYRFISENGVCSQEELLLQLKLPPQILFASLTSLEIQNLIVRNLDGSFEAISG